MAPPTATLNNDDILAIFKDRVNSVKQVVARGASLKRKALEVPSFLHTGLSVDGDVSAAAHVAMTWIANVVPQHQLERCASFKLKKL